MIQDTKTSYDLFDVTYYATKINREELGKILFEYYFMIFFNKDMCISYKIRKYLFCVLNIFKANIRYYKIFTEPKSTFIKNNLCYRCIIKNNMKDYQEISILV